MLWLHWRRPWTGKHYCQALHKDDWTQVTISTQVTSNLGNKDTIRAKIPTPSQATTRQTNGWETDFERNVKDEGPEMPTHPPKLGGRQDKGDKGADAARMLGGIWGDRQGGKGQERQPPMLGDNRRETTRDKSVHSHQQQGQLCLFGLRYVF